MPQIQISYFSDTCSTVAILLILALQITSIIVFYHHQSIMRNEFKNFTKNHEKQGERHSGLTTEISKLDNPTISPANSAAIMSTLSTPTTGATHSTVTTGATPSTATTAATLSTATTAATLSTATTAATLSTATTGATPSTATTAATLSTATTGATPSTATTGATLSTATKAATLSRATTVGVSTTNTNFLVENETIRRYSDLVIPYSNWSAKVNYFDCVHPLELPITKVYVLETNTYICFDYKRCKARMISEWNWYKNRDYADIQYHFLIGGDGSIFEGLSWNCSQHYYAVPDRSSIVVALTGYTYNRIYYIDVNYEVSKKQYAALKLFIMANLINGNL